MAAITVLNQLALFAGPFLASPVMTRLTTGSLKIWMASLLRWRVPPVAYLLALAAVAGGRDPWDPRPQGDQLGAGCVGEGDGAEKVTNLWPAALGLAVLAVIGIAVTRGRLGCRRSH